MFTMTFRWRGFAELPVVAKKGLLFEGVKLLALVNTAWLKLHPETPSIYRSGVRYQREPDQCPVLNPQFGKLEQNCETWCDIPEAIARRVADCKVLVAWRLAELWRAGERDAKPLVTSATDGSGQTIYHIALQRGQAGGFAKEDPSRTLGM